MEQQKIGKFILKLRMEKGLTQKELADKLGVTDKAVSKWETGKGMPDSSMLMPIASEFGVTVNEILCGERISDVEFKEKSGEMIVKTIQNYNKRKRNNWIIAISILFVVIASFALLVPKQMVDEYVQSTFDSRTGLYADMAINICYGLLLGVVLCNFLSVKASKKGSLIFIIVLLLFFCPMWVWNVITTLSTLLNSNLYLFVPVKAIIALGNVCQVLLGAYIFLLGFEKIKKIYNK